MSLIAFASARIVVFAALCLSLSGAGRWRPGRRAAELRDSRCESRAGIGRAAGERHRAGVARSDHGGGNECSHSRGRLGDRGKGLAVYRAGGCVHGRGRSSSAASSGGGGNAKPPIRKGRGRPRQLRGAMPDEINLGDARIESWRSAGSRPRSLLPRANVSGPGAVLNLAGERAGIW